MLHLRLSLDGLREIMRESVLLAWFCWAVRLPNSQIWPPAQEQKIREASRSHPTPDGSTWGGSDENLNLSDPSS